jgi:hypothetical protein
MARDLDRIRVAILATDGVERLELEQPRGALYGVGAASELLSIHPGEIQARQFDLVSAGTFRVDRLVSEASAGDYHALLLPGGTVNPDQLRINADAVGFAIAFAATGRPIAAICHGLSSRSGPCAGTGSPHGPACGPTCAGPVLTPLTSRSSSTGGSLPAGLRRTCPPSVPRSSSSSRPAEYRAECRGFSQSALIRPARGSQPRGWFPSPIR